MKFVTLLLVGLLAFLPFAQADQFEDDFAKFQDLLEDNADFFDLMTMQKELVWPYDESTGQAAAIDLDKAEIRKLIKEFRAMPNFWDYADQARCDALSLDSASMGACIQRNMALSLTAFYLNFQATKRAIRSQNLELSIVAVQNFSSTVKKVALFTNVTCELESASAWGGSGQGMMQAGCFIAEVDKATTFLQAYRTMLNEGDNSTEMQKRRQLAKAFTAAEWQAQIDKNMEWYASAMVDLKNDINKYFDEYSETAAESTNKTADYWTTVWRSTAVDYCTTYAMITFPKGVDYAQFGVQGTKACMNQIVSDRIQQVYEIKTTFQSL